MKTTDMEPKFEKKTLGKIIASNYKNKNFHKDKIFGNFLQFLMEKRFYL